MRFKGSVNGLMRVFNVALQENDWFPASYYATKCILNKDDIKIYLSCLVRLKVLSVIVPDCNGYFFDSAGRKRYYKCREVYKINDDWMVKK